jgi:hypothetical protein
MFSNLLADLAALCRSEPKILRAWLDDANAKLLVCVFWILVGCSAYGFTLGVWRAPMMGVFVGIKFPMFFVLVAFINAGANGMLAKLLGAPFDLRQSALLVLMSFALTAIILGSLAPLSMFLAMNLPEVHTEQAKSVHHTFLLIHVALISFAGILANGRLWGLLAELCGSKAIASRVLIAWRLCNLFVGAQLSWNLRPFFGTPQFDVVLFRPDAFDGSFYEAVFKMIKYLF